MTPIFSQRTNASQIYWEPMPPIDALRTNAPGESGSQLAVKEENATKDCQETNNPHPLSENQCPSCLLREPMPPKSLLKRAMHGCMIKHKVIKFKNK